MSKLATPKKVKTKVIKFLNRYAGILLSIVSSRVFLLITFLWFVVQSTLIAFITKFGLPPDEVYHYNFIQLFTENGWLPFLKGQEGYYHLGEVVKTPFFLYHYLLSIPNHLFIQTGHSVLLLRLTNVLLGVASLYLAYRIAVNAKLSKLAVNLSVFMFANTIMFVFLSASINYDNLFLALSLSCLLLVLRIIKKPSIVDTSVLILALLSGIFIKKNFIPVAIVLGTVFVFWAVKNWQPFSSSIKKGWHVKQKTLIPILVLLAIFLGLFFQRYASNLINYQSIKPRCDIVLTLEQCRENGLFVRSERLDSSPRPAITKNGYEYIFGWSALMGQRIFGVFAHKSFVPLTSIFFGLQTIIAVCVVAVIRKLSAIDWRVNLLLGIAIAYSIILILENYLRYRKYGSFDFAVQGRYVFFALPLFYISAIHYVSKIQFLKKIFMGVFTLAAITVVLLSGLPSYLLLIDSSWLNEGTARFIDRF